MHERVPLPNEYECAACHEVFEKTDDAEWSDIQAYAECEARFGKMAPDNLAIVCHNCYEELMYGA